MLRHLVQRAAHCQQTITYECRGSRLPGYGWWGSCTVLLCHVFLLSCCDVQVGVRGRGEEGVLLGPELQLRGGARCRSVVSCQLCLHCVVRPCDPVSCYHSHTSVNVTIKQ